MENPNRRPGGPEIALDISFLGIPDGIGTYTAGLLGAFQRLYRERSFLLLRNRFPQDLPLYRQQEQLLASRLTDLPARWQSRQTDIRHRLIWQGLVLPRLLRGDRPRLYHALDNLSLPPFRKSCPFVLTLHDLVPITHPQYCRRRDAVPAAWLIRRAVRQADIILTISEYSRGCILDAFPDAASRVRVVLSGVDHVTFFPAADREQPAREMAQQYRLFSSRFLLAVSTLNPRKNLECLLRAFASYLHAEKDPSLCLVVVGCRGWMDHPVFEQVQALRLQERIHFLHFVAETDLVKLYQSALAYVNPSLLEGFGLPVLEAMACGTPVVCSSTTALGETAGEAAVLVNPEKEESLLEGLSAVVQSRSRREELAVRGRARSLSFHWDSTARKTMDVYSELI